MIRKIGKNKYRLYSGKGKNLGTFSSHAAAEKHEREVQYFKHKKNEGINEMNASMAVQGVGAAIKPKDGGKKRAKYKLAHVSESERMLREAIRKVIFLSKLEFYENKGREYLQEQKLRKVIRSLLAEKAEKPMLPTTVDNFTRDAMDKIFTGYKKTFMSMPDKPENRNKYVAVLGKYMESVLGGLERQLSGEQVVQPTEQEPVSAAPAVGSQPVLPSDAAALEEQDGEMADGAPAEPVDPEEQNKQMINALSQQASTSLQGVADSGKGRAGAIAAYDEDGPTFAGMIAPFVNKLDPEDRAPFIQNLVQSIKLTGQAFETELNDKAAKAAAPGTTPATSGGEADVSKAI